MKLDFLLPPLPKPDICDPFRFGLGYHPQTLRKYAEESIEAYKKSIKEKEEFHCEKCNNTGNITHVGTGVDWGFQASGKCDCEYGKRISIG